MNIKGRIDHSDIRTIEHIKEGTLIYRVCESQAECGYTHELTIRPTLIENELYSLDSLFHFLDAIRALGTDDKLATVYFLIRGNLLTQRMVVTVAQGLVESKIYFASVRRRRDAINEEVLDLKLSALASLYDTPIFGGKDQL